MKDGAIALNHPLFGNPGEGRVRVFWNGDARVWPRVQTLTTTLFRRTGRGSQIRLAIMTG